MRPIARAARAAATVSHSDLRLTLALSPSQFANGREARVVQDWGLFDRIVDSAQCVRLAFGLSGLRVAPRAAVVHLGGDLWISARLAKHLHLPVCALAETMMIARRHRPFSEIFATTEELATRLATAGVPRQKIVVSGDPRADLYTEADGAGVPSVPRFPASGDGHYTLTMLPGSRDRFFQYLIPLYVDIAGSLVAMHPDMTFQIVASPFLSPNLVERTREEIARSSPNLHIAWIRDASRTALAQSDLALTIPGTNTLELAMAGIPFAVILPTHHIEAIPREGVVEWLGRIPALGRMVKTLAFRWYFAKPRFIALPNIRAGQLLVPEWIGRWTPGELANRLADILHDPDRRAAMATTLRHQYGGPAGASAIVASHACALAHAAGTSR